MGLFSDQDKQRIEQRIHDAESKTAAEIVVATVGRSDHYADVRLRAAVVLGVGGSAALHLIFPALGAGELMAIQLLLGALSYWLSGLPGLLRRLLPPPRVRAAVQREAELRFLEHGLFATRGRNGVLILVSELEHNVAILGDQGIHQRVENGGWEHHVATMVSAIRAGRAAEGVCQVIDELAPLLAAIDPVQPGDVNELDNRVRSH